jgi:hypothetical protein
MTNKIKKISSYFLVLLVLLTTVLAILEIWGIHLLNYEDIFWRLIKSLVMILCASAVTLFIFAVLLKEK